MGFEADHELDAAGARERIEREFPDLEFHKIEFCAEGFDFRMFEVDDLWLFRFPKRKEEIARLEREIAFLDRIAGEFPVEVPRFTWRAPEVAGYRKLAGHEMLGRTPTPRFAETLGDTLATLHAIPPERFEGQTMPGVAETGGLPSLRDRNLEVLESAREALSPELLARCERVLAEPVPPPFHAAPVVIHNDIYPSHVLLADDGAIRGLIDWADANVGDPAPDFSMASFWGGEPYLETALERYPHPCDASFRDRARCTARYEGVAHITYGALTNKPEHMTFGVDALDRIDA